MIAANHTSRPPALSELLGECNSITSLVGKASYTSERSVVSEPDYQRKPKSILRTVTSTRSLGVDYGNIGDDAAIPPRNKSMPGASTTRPHPWKQTASSIDEEELNYSLSPGGRKPSPSKSVQRVRWSSHFCETPVKSNTSESFKSRFQQEEKEDTPQVPFITMMTSSYEVDAPSTRTCTFLNVDPERRSWCISKQVNRANSEGDSCEHSQDDSSDDASPVFSRRLQEILESDVISAPPLTASDESTESGLSPRQALVSWSSFRSEASRSNRSLSKTYVMTFETDVEPTQEILDRFFESSQRRDVYQEDEDESWESCSDDSTTLCDSTISTSTSDEESEGEVTAEKEGRGPPRLNLTDIFQWSMPVNSAPLVDQEKRDESEIESPAINQERADHIIIDEPHDSDGDISRGFIEECVPAAQKPNDEEEKTFQRSSHDSKKHNQLHSVNIESKKERNVDSQGPIPVVPIEVVPCKRRIRVPENNSTRRQVPVKELPYKETWDTASITDDESSGDSPCELSRTYLRVKKQTPRRSWRLRRMGRI